PCACSERNSPTRAPLIWTSWSSSGSSAGSTRTRSLTTISRRFWPDRLSLGLRRPTRAAAAARTRDAAARRPPRARVRARPPAEAGPPPRGGGGGARRRGRWGSGLPRGGTAPAGTSPIGTPGAGATGGVIGVASKSKDKSIRLYNGRNHYNEWAFINTPQTQTP